MEHEFSMSTESVFLYCLQQEMMVGFPSSRISFPDSTVLGGPYEGLCVECQFELFFHNLFMVGGIITFVFIFLFIFRTFPR